jgi:multiple sugar transport system permease protein
MAKKNIFLRIVAHLTLGIGSLIMLIPFLWMLSTSLKSLADVFVYPPRIFGKTIMWSNYLRISDQFPFYQMLLNTVKITVCVVLGQLLTSAMAGFAFSYLKYRGKNALFSLYLASIMIPYHVILVPTFILLHYLKLLDTHWALILPALVSPFGAFMMRQFFTTIPEDLGNAAKIDGCTPFGVFWRIFLPLSKPAITTLAILAFIGTWNDFLRPLVFLSNNIKMTLTLGIYTMQGMFSTDWPALMAVVVLSLLPAVTAFLAAQDVFVRGVTMTGMKG